MRNEKIKRMTTLALLVALIIVLQLLGGVITSASGFSISLVLIPVVLGSAMYGPSAGALLGGSFGVVVFINCLTGADAGGAMVLQANPILCFVVVMAKGILAGLASGWMYRLLKEKNTYLAMLCAAIVCPMVNTGIFITCLLTLFNGVLSAWHLDWLSKGGSGDVFAYVMSGLIVGNFLPELAINVVFSPAGQRILQVVQKNK